MNYILANTSILTALSIQVNAGVNNNPDVNGNGIGVSLNNDTYVAGICGAAIASGRSSPARAGRCAPTASQTRSY